MVVEAWTPFPVQEPETAALEILPSSAGRVLDSGPAWADTGGQGELVVTSHGLVACDLRSGEYAGVDWQDFDPATDIGLEGDASTLLLHFSGFEPVVFTIDSRLAANIVAIYPFDSAASVSTNDEVQVEDQIEVDDDVEEEFDVDDDERDQDSLPVWATTVAPPDDDFEPAAPLLRRSWFWGGATALLIAGFAVWALVAPTSDDGSIEIAALSDDGGAGGIGSSDVSETLSTSPSSSTTTQATTTTVVATTVQRLTLPTVAPSTSRQSTSSTAAADQTINTTVDLVTDTESSDQLSTSPTTTTEPTGPTASTSVPAEGDCHPAYENCVPFHPGDALDCSDIDTSGGPVRLRKIGVDPYNLDDDEDGIACENDS